MIVVCNTSPLTNLAAIKQFNLLRHLYSQITIPDEVWEELNCKGKSWPGSKEVGESNWINRKKASNRQLLAALRRDLDQGEAATIALALELNAGLVLLDEKDGRHIAQRLGLKVIGVMGILLKAKKKGLIKSLQPHLDDLRETAGFYITDSVYRSVLEVAGEK